MNSEVAKPKVSCHMGSAAKQTNCYSKFLAMLLNHFFNPKQTNLFQAGNLFQVGMVVKEVKTFRTLNQYYT